MNLFSIECPKTCSYVREVSIQGGFNQLLRKNNAKLRFMCILGVYNNGIIDKIKSYYNHELMKIKIIKLFYMKYLLLHDL